MVYAYENNNIFFCLIPLRAAISQAGQTFSIFCSNSNRSEQNKMLAMYNMHHEYSELGQKKQSMQLWYGRYLSLDVQMDEATRCTMFGVFFILYYLKYWTS